MQTAQVIACSKVITLHLLQSRQPTAVYNPHKGIVNSIHINHTSIDSVISDKVIASGGQDGRIVLVNAIKPDNQVFETSFHSGTSIQSVKLVSVNCIMFSSQSHYIAAGSSDFLVKIWDMKNHKHVFSTIKSHVSSVNSLAWIRNLGIEKIQGQILASASSIGDIFLHSVKSSNIVQTLNSKNQQCINQIKVSQSEGHCRLAASTASGSVMVWNLRNLQKDTNPMCYFNNGKKSSATSVSFSSFNPVLLASSSMDQTLTFYDVNQKKSVKVITCEEPLTSINFHSDGHTLLAGGNYGGLFVYDLRKPSKPREKLIGHDSAIKHAIFIKEYEPSSSTMSASRASKSSSVNSFNSRAPSSKSNIDQNKDIKIDNYVEPAKKIDSNVNVSQETKFREMKSSDKFVTKKESSAVKLSSTGQEAIKNADKKSILSRVNPASTTSTGYNYYTKNPAQSGSTLNLPPKTTEYSIPKQASLQEIPQNKSLTSQQQKPPISVYRGIENQQIQELRSLIEERFENMQMQLIHQFHLQQKDIKQMINSLLIEDKKKTQKIKELQKQIFQLKNNTY